MNEPLFGGPMWTGTPPFGVGWPSGPISLSSRPANQGLVGFASPQIPLAGPFGTNVPGTQQMTSFPIPDPYAFGSPQANLPPQTLLGAGFNTGFPAGPIPFATPAAFPPFAGPEFATPTGIPALLAVVAVRRGQPMGPSNDQECEDFVYDALEYLPGASEVEVRCEGGRVTLTGSVQHKRLKRDVGEIAWAIPVVSDVVNNVTLTTKRRSRGTGRESDSHSGGSSRKQS